MLNKKTQIKYMLIIIVFILLGVCCNYAIGKAQDDEPIYNINFSESEYLQNSFLTLPQGTAVLGGNSYELLCNVNFPDGRINGNTYVKLDTCGQYKLIASFNVNKKTYSKEINFTVGTNPAALFSNVKNSIIENNSTTPSYMPKSHDGILVTSSTSGAEIKYNSLVDLSDNTINDPLFELIYTPNSVGNTEINYINVKFTDYFDSTNTLTFTLITGKKIGWQQYILVSAYGANQPFYLDNAFSALNISTAGVYDGKSPSMTIFLDYETLKVYGNPDPDGEPYDKSIKKYLCNLTDTYKQNDFKKTPCEAWTGFTTGLAYMSIKVNELSNAQSKYMLLNVDGLDLGAKKIENISEKVKISINYDDYDEFNLPKGIINHAYSIFDSVAFSQINGIIGIDSISVLYDMNDVIPIVDNKFIPSKSGNYYILYETTSVIGTSARKIVKVTILDDYVSPLEYKFSDKILTSNVLLDERAYLYDGVVLGGSGRLNVKNEVLLNDENINIFNDNGANYFIPEKTGVYKYKVIISDFINNTKTYTLEINVPKINKIIIKKPSLPVAICIGKEFTFPDAYSIKYVNGEKTSIDTIIKVDGIVIVDDKYMPTTVKVLKIEYIAETEKYITAMEVVNINIGTKGFMKNYFVQSNGNIEMTADGVKLSSQALSSKFSFINKISVSYLEFNLNFIKQFSNFSSFDLILRDSVNCNTIIKISISIKNNNENVFYITINGKDKKELQYDAFEQSMILKYDFDNMSLLTNNATNIGAIVAKENGEKFEGFESGFVYADFEVNGNTDKFEIMVSQIANQYMLNVSRDTAGPVIYFAKPEAYAKKFNINENVKVSKPFAYDVLTVDSTVNVKIVAPDETVIFNGVLIEDLNLQLKQAGRYFIEYKAIDLNKNESELLISISVSDNIPPKIVLKKGYKTKSSIGVYSLKGVELNDNLTSNDKINVLAIIINDLGQMYFCDSNDVKFSKIGKYIIRYVAYDENSNSSSVEYTVNIE